MTTEAPSNSNNSEMIQGSSAKRHCSRVSTTLTPNQESTNPAPIKILSPMESTKTTILDKFVQTLHPAAKPFQLASLVNFLQDFATMFWKEKKQEKIVNDAANYIPSF